MHVAIASYILKEWNTYIATCLVRRLHGWEMECTLYKYVCNVYTSIKGMDHISRYSYMGCNKYTHRYVFMPKIGSYSYALCNLIRVNF